MYKVIIFDLDGTLLDTSADICEVLNDALYTFGCPRVSLRKTIESVGNGAKALIDQVVPPQCGNVREIYEYYRLKFAQCDNSHTKLYDGEDDFLINVKKSGAKMAILTNKPNDAALKVYNSFLSKYNFDIVLGHDERFPLKPAPEAVHYIMQQLGAGNSECLFVGDGETDIATAANASIDCVSVLWGYRSKEQLECAGGSVFANTFTELYEIFLKG